MNGKNSATLISTGWVEGGGGERAFFVLRRLRRQWKKALTCICSRRQILK